MVLSAVAAATLALSPAADCGPWVKYDSSVLDAERRWQVVHDSSGRCGGRVLSTDDGGKTWRTIYRAPRAPNRGPITAILRTSARAGVVFPPHLNRDRRAALITHDAGRTWRQTAAVGGPSAVFALSGRGDLVYEAARGRLTRITGWERGVLRRRVVWRETPSVALAALYFPPWFPLARTARGVVALAVPRVADPQRVALVAVDASRARTRLLPVASREIAALGGTALRDDDAGVVVRGRRIDVCATVVRRGAPKAVDVGTVGWESRDGGATWVVGASCAVRRPGG